MTRDGEIVCEVAGHGETPVFRISPSRHMCGHITDGVGLRHGDRAGYVLAFSDLETAYLAAKKFREENPPTEHEKQMAELLTAASKRLRAVAGFNAGISVRGKRAKREAGDV